MPIRFAGWAFCLPVANLAQFPSVYSSSSAFYYVREDLYALFAGRKLS
ncbi:hypothetical protein HNQ93_001597 [Hymenobacter luteus]|uniref:Uncharacterized protein n=2 Tax=Hymenobacter TaxID=89966 RepID=A0A7W9SZR3_9BACT|nr:hypothetical protein [Hymenobacter latericoloratus]MBB6058751.1 hypothetical protein [Hymenobacter luteus]